MRNAILLHGLPSKKEYYNPDYPSASNSHWFPWLQKQLLMKEIKTDTPEVFRAFEMNWDSWAKEVEQFEITESTTLVGHSMGGGFWVRYLTEHPEIYIDKLILVAPWINIKHEEDTSFFDFEVDVSLIERAKEMIIFASDNDGDEVQASVRFLHDKFPNVSFRLFHEYGHFTQRSLPTNTFPELLEAIL
jgi:predicted alpha/beta hydrolase family esterase